MFNIKPSEKLVGKRSILSISDFLFDLLLETTSEFCFVLNGTESQGIAVQEIMSYDTPMLVWDIESWEDQGPEWSVPATSIPYWSDAVSYTHLTLPTKA